jgi:hypothetical protein
LPCGLGGEFPPLKDIFYLEINYAEQKGNP